MMIFNKWFIVFALCLVTFVVSAENQEEVESPSSQAASFQAIVEKAERGDAEAQFFLGAMYGLGKGVAQNDVEAAKWFRKAAEQGHVGASGILGRILITQGKFDEARSVIEKAYQMEPQNVSLITNLGHTYLLKGDRQTARRHYQEALPLIPDDASFKKGPIAEFELFIENGWQVKACLSELKWIRSNFKQLKLAKAYNQRVIQYHQQWRFKEALPFAEKAFKIRTELLGKKHPLTLSSLNNLAIIYKNLGRLEEALPLFEQGYHHTKEVLGEKHPETLTILNHFAGIYRELGRLSEALPLFEKGFRLRKEVLGEKHLDTLTSLNNLAVIYQDLGRLSEALPLFEKSYHLSFEVLGKKHSSTLINLNNLALVYQKLGRFKEALHWFEKAYHHNKEELGEKHPLTLTSLNNLAGIYSYLGRLEEALPLFEQGYRLRKELLGDKHPETITSLINLAVIYQVLGRLFEALPLSKKAYYLSFEELGEKHPLTLNNLNGLARIYRDLGKLEEALTLLQKGYRLRKEVLGEKHPNTLDSLNNLSLIYRDIGQFEKALPLFKKCYRLRKKVFGEKHPETLTSLDNLAVIYQNLGRLFKALSLSEKGYHLKKEALGEKHPETFYSLNNLAGIYRDLGILEKALVLYEKGYRLRKEVLGEKNPETLISLNNLATIYRDVGRLSEALSLSKFGYRLFSEVLGEKHYLTLTSLENLAYTYLKQGNISEAIKHLEKFVPGVEHLRSSELSAENLQTLFKKRVSGYFWLSRLYIAKSRPFDAFRLTEMSKARTLLESLAAKIAAQQSGVTTTEQQQLQDYETRLASLNNRIAKTLNENRLENLISLETEKKQIFSQLIQFEQKLKTKYPKYAQLSKVEFISASAGTKYLSADAVLISYLVNEDHVLAFTLQADGVLTAHDLGETPNLKKDLETYGRLLSLGIQKQEKSAPSSHINKPIRLKKRPTIQSHQLGKQLLEPLKDIIKDKPHWIISPNGPLALIPFETLRLEDQPVIAQHQISYVQSLSVLAQLQKRDEVYKSLENRGTLLAMGAPIYENAGAATNKDHLGSVDFKIATLLAMRGGDYARAFRHLKWPTLHGAEREIEQLEELFKETKPGIYIKADATEAKLQSLNKKGVLAQYRYLVFSTHGYLSPQVPALSSVVLGQVNNPPEIDGYVTAGEWPGYDLKSDLMVLSACETGLGEVVGGEGVMGLPYAFYVAGNKNTILTLWKISDDITTEFIISFFTKLKAGVGQIEALTATKREFLEKSGRKSNPLFWAAFVLYGV